MPIESHNAGEEPPAISILRRLKANAPKDAPTRFIAVYLGVGLIISFLFLASVAPQLGEKLGTLSVQKKSQESQAAITNMYLNSNPITTTATPLKPLTIVTLRWSITRTSSGLPYYASCMGKSSGTGNSPWSGDKNVSLLRGMSYVQPSQTTTYTLECKTRDRVPKTETKEVTIHIAAPTGSSGTESSASGSGPCYPYGDVNGDQLVTAKDAEMILQYTAGLYQSDPNRYQELKVVEMRQKEANVTLKNLTDTADTVNSVDALWIQKYVANSTTIFPVCRALSAQ